MVRATVLTDGSSDRALLPIIRWTLLQAGVRDQLQLEWADLRNLYDPPKSLAERMARAVDLYPCDVLFVHRDAESQEASVRFAEIEAAVEQLNGQLSHVCVVPVRMLEAWLLCDETAIRKASGNPNGKSKIVLPKVQRREAIVDPKATLTDLLKVASGLSGRRLKDFNALRARSLVAQFMDDFSLLRELASFRAFEADVIAFVGASQAIRGE